MRTTVRADKADCTGCGACVHICPKGAISMRRDEEGFLYPAVDGALCVGCDLCEKKCPAGKEKQAREVTCLGAGAKDGELRRVSSSGGIFTLLAEQMQDEGGIVFGAAFDESLKVEHIGIIDRQRIASLRGSKYLQSNAVSAIGHAKQLLERGIPVLFSGTPCQVDGLLSLLGEKEKELLLTVDFVCHGVPSPGVFESYLEELSRKNGHRVVSYSFRDKRKGWKDFHAVAVFDDGSEWVGSQREEPFLYGFLQNLYLRPSCHGCTSLRENRRTADVTIADLWGAHQVFADRDDDTGLSLVLLGSDKGRAFFEKVRSRCETFPAELDSLVRFNPSLVRPVPPHRNRGKFMKLFKAEGFKAEKVMALLAPPGRLERLTMRILHLPKGLMRRARGLIGKS